MFPETVHEAGHVFFRDVCTWVCFELTSYIFATSLDFSMFTKALLNLSMSCSVLALDSPSAMPVALLSARISAAFLGLDALLR